MLSRVVWAWSGVRTATCHRGATFRSPFGGFRSRLPATPRRIRLLVVGFRLLVKTIEPLSGMRRLQRKLFRKLRADGFERGEDGVLHVGVAPEPGQADYGGFKHLDEGLLYLGADALVFVGETLRFSIGRQDARGSLHRATGRLERGQIRCSSAKEVP